MRLRQALVCLLALAGSVSVFSSAVGPADGPPQLRDISRARPVPIKLEKARSVKSTGRTDLNVHGLNSSSFKPTRADSPRQALAQLSIPMTFEPNAGQVDDSIQFVGRGRGLTVFLAHNGIVLQLGKPNSGITSGKNGKLTLRLAGSNWFNWAGEGRLPGESNYFVGNDPQRWRTRVPHFARARTTNLPHAMGVEVYGNDDGDGVEYDLRVPPGVDSSNLRLTLVGAERARIDGAGDLLISASGQEVRMKKPKVYEASHTGWHSAGSRRHGSLGARRAGKYSPRQTRGKRSERLDRPNPRPKHASNPCAHSSARGSARTGSGNGVPCVGPSGARSKAPEITQGRLIESKYVIEADGSIGFSIGPHDSNATLIVDPSLSVSYGTFLGGSGSNSAASIAVDGSGNIYVGGTTTSPAFPGTTSRKLGPADGASEFFVAKINPTLTGANSLIYLTFFGGSGTQSGGLIAVDKSGNVAITGTTTATDFPVTDASQPTSGLATGFGNDVIVSEIGPAGNTLVFSTLFGGSGAESQSGGGGIAFDTAGDVYVASDVKTTLVNSASADLPVTTGAFQTIWGAESGDAFLAIFAPPPTAGAAAVLRYCTYLGTNSIDEPGVGGVAVDVSGNAYIAGTTSNGATEFPTKNAIQTAYGGGESDAFLMKISPVASGPTDLVYATLLGGSSADEVFAVALDSQNPANAYVTGTTQSPNFPVNGAVAPFRSSLVLNAKSNAFLSVVSQNAITGQSALAYSTYFGGSQTDTGQGVVALAPNAVYLAGTTTSPDIPWHDNLQAFNGGSDAFVAKFDTTLPGTASLIYVTPLGGTSPVGRIATASGNALAADNAGHVYIAGSSTSGDFPSAVTTESAVNGFQSSCSSCELVPALPSGFVAEIAESPVPMPSVYFNVGHVPFVPVSIGESATPQLVGVLNGGEANLTITDVEIAGPSAADFSLIGATGCLNRSISPGLPLECSFEVGFAPSTPGPGNAVVIVTDNAPGSPQLLELIATGQSPLPTVSPTTLNFGSQADGSASAPMAVTLTNSGTATLTLGNIVEGGPDAVQFAPSQGGQSGSPQCQNGASIPPGRACALSFTFHATAVRTFNAEVDLFGSSTQSSNAEEIAPLRGTGVASSPIVSLGAPTLMFGSENVGSRSAAQTISLTNVGSATLAITNIALTGTDTTDFAMATAGTTCPVSGGTVGVQATCLVAIQLVPQSPGFKTATLSFADNAPSSPQRVTISGTGAMAPSLQVSPASLTFGAESAATSSSSQNVTVLNSGGAPAEISGISVSGINAGDFSAPASCTPNPVPVGKVCQIAVSFTPIAGNAGTRSGALNIPGGSPPALPLAGTATQPGISVTSNVNFGSQLSGGAGGMPQKISVTNNSAGAFAGSLVVASVTKSGANAGDFVLSTDAYAGVVTPPGAACTLLMAFKPLQGATCGANGGSRAATLVLNDNAPGSPHSIPISGTATDFCVNSAVGQAVIQPITAGQSATYLLEIDSFAGFAGSAALSCAVPASLLGTCTVTTVPVTNPPAVLITPTGPGQFQVVVTTTAAVTTSAARREWKTEPLRPGRIQILLTTLLCIALLLISNTSLRRRRIARLMQMAALVLMSAVTIAACSGKSSSTPVAATPSTIPGTPPGAYVTMVSATVTIAGQPGVTRTFPLSLTVQ